MDKDFIHAWAVTIIAKVVYSQSSGQTFEEALTEISRNLEKFSADVIQINGAEMSDDV